MHQSSDRFVYIVIIIWLAAVGSFIFRVARYGGVTASFYGRRISRTLGEVKVTTGRKVRTVLKVHVLESGVPKKAIGLELVSRAFGGVSLQPMAFSKIEAMQLVELLQAAVAETP